MSATKTIEGRGLEKVYGTGELAFRALKEVDFAADPGEMVMIVGPSGSGKSTLLSILGCVLSPTSGELYLGGRRIDGLREKRLAAIRLHEIGFIFQGHNLIAALPAIDNVAMMLEMQGLSMRQAKREARELLEHVGLGDKLRSVPADMSGGQRQRVAIARALAGKPPLLLADEPTASLDAETGRLVTESIRELTKASGVTAIIVTHDNRIFHYADRIVHIEDGSIVAPHKEKTA